MKRFSVSQKSVKIRERVRYRVGALESGWARVGTKVRGRVMVRLGLDLGFRLRLGLGLGLRVSYDFGSYAVGVVGEVGALEVELDARLVVKGAVTRPD